MLHLISHAHCFDGSATAYAFRKFFGTGDDRQYHYLSYDSRLPDLKSGDVVYMGDYSRSATELLRLVEQGVSVTLIDHHESALVEALKVMRQVRLRSGFRLTQVKANTDIVQALEELFAQERTDDDYEDWVDKYALTKLRYHIVDRETVLNVYIDMDRCGSYLVWNYLFPDEQPPNLFAYIDTRDRWVWELPDAEEVTEGWGVIVSQASTELAEEILKDARRDITHPLHSLANTLLEPPDYMTKRHILSFADLPTADYNLHQRWLTTSDKIAILKKIGAPAVEERRQIVNATLEKATWMYFLGHWVPAVEAYNAYSWVGNELANNYPDAPFAVTYKVINNGQKLEFSLRVRKESCMRVNRIARLIGGGGHPKAAGATLVRYQYRDQTKPFGVPEVVLKDGIPVRIADPINNPDPVQDADTYVFAIK